MACHFGGVTGKRQGRCSARKRGRKEPEILFCSLFLFLFLKSGPVQTTHPPRIGGGGWQSESLGVPSTYGYSRLFWKWDPKSVDGTQHIAAIGSGWGAYGRDGGQATKAGDPVLHA